MGLVTYVEPDVLAIEKDWLDHWRVHNGQDFVHGFKTRVEAREFAVRNGGSAIALCTLHNGTYIYTKREIIKNER